MTSPPGACERLAASRERLRQAMQQVGGNSEDLNGTRGDSLLNELLSSLQSTGGTSLLGDVLTAWWRKQPVSVALPLALETAKVLVQPLARRHPYTLVLGAAAAGSLLVLARPWRWMSTPAMVASLLSRVMS